MSPRSIFIHHPDVERFHRKKMLLIVGRNQLHQDFRKETPGQLNMLIKTSKEQPPNWPARRKLRLVHLPKRDPVLLPLRGGA
jgi:hypothetical protein